MLNIPSTVVDKSYRYVMPRMQLKIESKGNGIKTNIVNLQDVAEHLRTKPSYILKFLAFEKATQVSEKTSQAKSNKAGKSNTSYIIQGEFTYDELLKVLDKFIDKYILCPKCKLPELHLYINKEKIGGKCAACPFNGEIDNKHKLAAFIIKNPPEEKAPASKRNQKIIKVEADEKKEHKEVTPEETVGEEKVEEEEEQEESNAVDKFSAESIEFGNEELNELVEHTKKLILSRMEKDFDIGSAEIVADLKPLKLKKPLYAYVLFNAFFTVNIHKQAKEYAPMYKHLMKKLGVKDFKEAGSKEEAEKLKNQGVEIETMLNVEYLYLEINKEKDFSKNISTILMAMYTAQMFSEQFIKDWSSGNIKDLDKMFMYNQERDEKFKEMAKDFIAYINDEDDDEDEDDD